MLTLGIIPLSRQSKCVTNSCYRGQWVRLYRILQNWEIRETGNLSCEYFCNWQSCPSKGWLCRESSETVLKKVEIGGKNLRKHFLENISFRLFQNFFFNTPCTAMWKKKQFWRFGKNPSWIGDTLGSIQFNLWPIIKARVKKSLWEKFKQKMLQIWQFFWRKFEKTYSLEVLGSGKAILVGKFNSGSRFRFRQVRPCISYTLCHHQHTPAVSQ